MPSKIKSVDIKNTTKKGKKMSATFKDAKGNVVRTTYFGASGYSDYTLHKDKERRARYRKRHAKDVITKDFTTAGHLSMDILWGDSSNKNTAIKEYKNKYKLK
tara:strand:+ start:17021 stop:17329 length:309 start_codon:yes stop_codon:yes gene_type:complete